MKTVKRLFIIAVVGYLAIVALLMIFENALVYPAPKYPIGDWQQTLIEVEDVELTSDDGTRLHGWFVEHPQPRGNILYFHGNGENVGEQADFLQDLRDRSPMNVFVFDYRGYGKSEGRPNERGIQLDARAALGWLNQRTETQPSDIIFYGRSLGAAVAVELAEAKGCKALVLQSAFSSLPDAASTHYPWVPVHWLMRNRYPSFERIRNCPQPLLQVHGTADRIVPLWSAKKLFDAAPSQRKQFLELGNEGHNDYPAASFWKAFDQFVDELAQKSR